MGTNLLNQASYLGNEVVTTTPADNKIVAGEEYFISDVATITTGDNLDFVLDLTDCEKRIVALPIEVKASSEKCYVYLYEGVAYSGGTETTMLNRNRNSSNVMPCKVYAGATISDTGKQIIKRASFSSGNPQQSKGVDVGASTLPMPLKDGSVYLLRITNTGAASTEVDYEAYFCECKKWSVK